MSSSAILVTRLATEAPRKELPPFLEIGKGKRKIRWAIRRIERPLPADDLLNRAAVAFEFDLNFHSIWTNQRRRWLGYRGDAPKVHWHSVTDARKHQRKQAFFRRGDIATLLAPTPDDETAQLFRDRHGNWLRTKTSATRLLNRKAGERADRFFAEQGINFWQVWSPITRHRTLVCDETVFEQVRRKRLESREPPPINGRPSMWLHELAKQAERLRHGRDPKTSYNLPVWWITKACRHLDGEKLRAEREHGAHRRQYVDYEQATRILESIRAELADLAPDGFVTLPQLVEKLQLTKVADQIEFGRKLKDARDAGEIRFVERGMAGRPKVFYSERDFLLRRLMLIGSCLERLSEREAADSEAFTPYLPPKVWRRLFNCSERNWPRIKQTLPHRDSSHAGPKLVAFDLRALTELGITPPSNGHPG
jgi:hypothetical protein